MNYFEHDALKASSAHPRQGRQRRRIPGQVLFATVALIVIGHLWPFTVIPPLSWSMESVLMAIPLVSLVPLARSACNHSALRANAVRATP
jgi:hypothetical protein